MGEDAMIRTASGEAVPPPPASEELAPHFPGLEILSLVGRGGAGAVYRAIQRDLGRQVALKILLLDPERDPTFGERFAREARAMASLSHPNVAAVHDAGRAGPFWYLVLEFVDGPNLRQLIRSRDLPPSEALDVVRQICSALEYAHGEGVVHRDVKPENVLVDDRGRVKLVDFGLAKLLQPKVGTPTLTGSTQAMGTWDYMAPEQLRRPLEVDHRADIYSLGVVLYELLTGEVPQGRYEPASRRARTDRRIDAIVDRALEQDPSRRYQEARGVREDVERVQSGPEASEACCGEPGASFLARRTARHAERRETSEERRCDVAPRSRAVWGIGCLVLALAAFGFLILLFGLPASLVGIPAEETVAVPVSDALSTAPPFTREEVGLGRSTPAAALDVVHDAWQLYLTEEQLNVRSIDPVDGGWLWRLGGFRARRSAILDDLLVSLAAIDTDWSANDGTAFLLDQLFEFGYEEAEVEVRRREDRRWEVRVRHGDEERMHMLDSLGWRFQRFRGPEIAESTR